MTHSASFFSSSEIAADTPTPLSSIGEESGGARSPANDWHVGDGLPLSSDPIQEMLATAARWPLPIPNRARGEADLDLPGVLRVPLVNAPGKFALIDADDYPLVQRYRWRLSLGYAVATSGQKLLRMHRLILMLLGNSLEVDHRSGNGLDNRKQNLRPCTHPENSWNQVRRVNQTTGVRGVRVGPRGIFVAQVVQAGRAHEARFSSLEAASEWVRAKRIELHGEFACHGERELDGGADYFQAQGRLAAARLEGSVG